MGKREIRPIVTPNLPLNRSSQKVAYMNVSRISTHKQNLVTITQGVSFPRMREIAHQRCLGLLGFFPGSSNGPQTIKAQPIFTQITSNDAVPRKDVPFWG